ncbi:SGNH hydrolase [Globomyces pollinis-pini]|nr:SGNH hydrolase [Globomyces pollinis-pini]
MSSVQKRKEPITDKSDVKKKGKYDDVSVALDQILLFGDSITQQGFGLDRSGFAASLQNAYIRKVDIINRGLSGYNTRWCLKVVDQVLSSIERKHPTKTLLTILFLGANDSVVDGVQTVPLEEYKQNLIELCTKIQSVSPVLLITPPPVDGAKWTDRTLSNTKMYRDACIGVAEELSVDYVDTWKEFLGNSLKFEQKLADELFDDGLHLASKANKLLYVAIIRKIKSKFPLLHPDILQPTLPWWADIDPDNVQESLLKLAKRVNKQH